MVGFSIRAQITSIRRRSAGRSGSRPLIRSWPKHHVSGFNTKAEFANGSPAAKWPNCSRSSNPRARCSRMRNWLISWIGYITIRVIGRTMRWQSVGDSHLDDIYKSGKRAIFTFWHGRIFPATYYWRNRGIVVMTSMSRDGEPIAQCIQHFGFGAARGSSSAGWLRALAEMARAIRNGRDAAFTVDGPRGPRYQAQQGPILL